MFDFKVKKEWSQTQQKGLFTDSYLFWLTNFNMKLPMNTKYVDLGEP